MAGSNLFLVKPYSVSLRFESLDLRVDKVAILARVADKNEGLAVRPIKEGDFVRWQHDFAYCRWAGLETINENTLRRKARFRSSCSDQRYDHLANGVNSNLLIM